ncbi:DUF1540 domain-containing protein [Qiania dongpingensis]|uniref:DUF1540 domain-containing protein n=1 Tax=Qiania dongpingensis TaxID=2763669 RepID=A0A7G9G5P1_9FIRM|nr:DUF1540 domain-containing protein [Qiania dongpingensis]QNM06123.1 DUF1540 domain-containing protein [Qiania dongpingensis]
MTNLSCSAETCIHNSDKCCCKGEILVDGANAKCCSETCCASFDERVQGCCTNEYETPCHALSVECEAESCVFNESRKCTAKEISIAGHGAKNANHTECASYRSR